jgi:hypothetical protein
MVTRIGELGTSAITSNRSKQQTIYYNTILRCVLRSLVTANALPSSCPLDDGGDTFLRNVGSYRSHAYNFTEGEIVHRHRREYLKSYVALTS